jgi:hypothetical protein
MAITSVYVMMKSSTTGIMLSTSGFREIERWLSPRLFMGPYEQKYIRG